MTPMNQVDIAGIDPKRIEQVVTDRLVEIPILPKLVALPIFAAVAASLYAGIAPLWMFLVPAVDLRRLGLGIVARAGRPPARSRRREPVGLALALHRHRRAHDLRQRPDGRLLRHPAGRPGTHALDLRALPDRRLVAVARPRRPHLHARRGGGPAADLRRAGPGRRQPRRPSGWPRSPSASSSSSTCSRTSSAAACASRSRATSPPPTCRRRSTRRTATWPSPRTRCAPCSTT